MMRTCSLHLFVTSIALVGACRDDAAPLPWGATSDEADEHASGVVSGGGMGPSRVMSTGSPAGSSSDPQSASGGDGPPVRLDLERVPDVRPPCADEALDEGRSADALAFSYIWVSNSREGTISKIDTETLTEVARYVSRPDGMGDPSRTSVNLNGDVAVANRSGGITMFATRLEDCPNPSETSTGPDDVKPWPDGCVLWHAPFDFDSQRPVAWTRGAWDPTTCRYEDQRLWTSGHNEHTSTAEVMLLRDEDGSVEESVQVDGLATDIYGLYGGAVDGEGNFWATGLGDSWLYRVERDSLAVTAFDHNPVHAYGITVDHRGHVWTCDARVSRFDPLTEEFATADVDGTSGHWGCMEDGDGVLWVSGTEIFGIDIETLQVVARFEVPVVVRGISIDARGRVWGVSFVGNAAYRVDRESGEVGIVDGLNGPYTYSDMTGFALRNVTFPAG